MNEQDKITLDSLMENDPQSAYKAIMSNPAFAEYASQKMAEEMRAGRISTGIQALQQLGLTIGALNQIALSNRGVNQLTPPAYASVPGQSPELTQALYDAKRGAVDPSAVIAPARQGIEDAYSSALNQAKVGSGGQAGAYQALSQLANVERMRASLGLAPMAQQVQQSNQQNYNQLLGQRIGENQNQFMNRLYNSQLAFDQYGQDVQAVAGLGQAGRMNLVNASQGLSSALQAAAPYYRPTYRPFDDATNKYMDDVAQENISNLDGRPTFYDYKGRQGYDPINRPVYKGVE